MDSFNLKLQKQTTEDVNIISEFSDYYKDNDFPNDLTSLINFDKETNSIDKQFWANLEWMKLSNLSTNFKLVEDNVYSEDCIQGSIGNCYLISACSKLAEFPSRLRKIFVNNKINRAGIYSVRLFVDGFEIKITIDDYIPVLPNSKTPVFAKIPLSNNIWPLIIEKSWAKYMKNYQNTISGRPDEVFAVLTGAPCSLLHMCNFKTNIEKNSLFKKLQNYSLNSFLICAATSAQNENNNILGLNSQHAYSITFAFSFESSGKELKLIKLRNPWGKLNTSKFEGEIIKNNYLDIPEISKNIGVQDKGSFVLTFEEFLNNFSYIYLCFYHDTHSLTSHYIFEDELNHHFKCFKIDLRQAKNIKKDKIYFSVSKPTQLVFMNESKNDSSYCSIFVGKKLYDNVLEYVSHAEGYASQHNIELEVFEQYEYYIIVHIDSYKGHISNKPLQLGTVSCYSNEKYIKIDEVKAKTDELFMSLIYNYYMTFKSAFSDTLEPIDQNMYITKNTISLNNSNYSFILYENLSKTASVHLEVKGQVNKKTDVDGGIICNNNKSPDYFNIDKLLYFNEYYILSRYKCGVNYTYSYTIKDDEHNKKEVKAKGLSILKNQLMIKGNLIINKYMKHSSGIIFYFRNTCTDCFIKVNIKFTDISNLVSFDKMNSNGIYEIVLEPQGEYFLDYNKIEGSLGYSIKWVCSIEEFA